MTALTARQEQVARYVAIGFSDKRIASRTCHVPQ